MIEAKGHHWGLSLGALLWAVLLAGSVSPVGSQPDPAEAEDDLADLRSALVEVDQGLSAADEASLLAQDLDKNTTPGRTSDFLAGFWRLSARKLDRTSWRWDSKFAGRAGSARVHLRQRWQPGGAHEWRGAAIGWNPGPLRVQLGTFSVSSGLGLLLGGGNRNLSQAADRNLGKVGFRMAPWIGGENPKALIGGAMHWKGRGWEMTGFHGLSTADAGSVPPVYSGASLVRHLGRRLFGVSILNSTGGRGISAWSGWGHRGSALNLETALWDRDDTSTPTLSWQVTGTLEPEKKWRVQGSVAGAQGGSTSPLGYRPGLLKTRSGVGWALRWGLRPNSREKYWFLITGSSGEKTGSTTRKETRRGLDVIMERELSPDLSGEARVALESRNYWIWSRRFPWLPASLEENRTRALGQFRLKLRQPGFQLQTMVKVFRQDKGAGSQLRSHLGFNGRFLPGEWWQLRGGYGAAWGDGLDLVGAISPLPGLVQPRHWGKWQSETWLGLGLIRDGIEFWLAFSRRRPPRLSSYSRQEQIWGQLKFRW